MARDKITPADVGRMYERRSSVRGGVSAAEPDLDPGEIGKLPTGRTEQIWNHHDCQFAPDSHDAKYDNDTPNNWLRGAGDGISDATGKPGFDFGGSWRRANKGDDWSK